jgi:hypothetical protein
MNSKAIIKVSKTQDLEIPPEIKCQLQPDSEYEIIFNQDEIILKKISTSVKNSSSFPLRPPSGKSILRHAGTWKGEDFEECLQAVYDNRSEIEFA